MERKRVVRPLTPLELEIMKVLWDLGSANVQAVQAKLPGEPKLAYTTVQTMLNVLHRKGKVKRALKGRAYEYTPLVSRQKAIRATLHDLIDRLFGGSAEGLVMSLVESRHLTPEKLARLNRLIEQSQREGKEGRHGSS
jgi:BlaI family transcriptional regulator, penicillinase repressor